jgi:hypothetical protein
MIIISYFFDFLRFEKSFMYYQMICCIVGDIIKLQTKIKNQWPLIICDGILSNAGYSTMIDQSLP